MGMTRRFPRSPESPEGPYDFFGGRYWTRTSDLWHGHARP